MSLRAAVKCGAQQAGPTVEFSVLCRSYFQVCCGWRCDMFEVLEPVRGARPVNGGCGCDAGVLAELRALNWVLG